MCNADPAIEGAAKKKIHYPKRSPVVAAVNLSAERPSRDGLTDLAVGIVTGEKPTLRKAPSGAASEPILC